MDINFYKKYETYMLSQMSDSAHDCQHIYRVLYSALDIAESENDVDAEVLIVACLLHDIGRKRQFENPSLCHALEGGEMAYDYLIKQGWNTDKANHVRKCIISHRYRTNHPPESIEAKILFDSDKLDVTGAMGIARTLIYKGQVNEPLYLVDANGFVLDGTNAESPSFFQEYNFKLKNLYGKFFTMRGGEIANQRRVAAVNFYKNIYDEVNSTHEKGRKHLQDLLICTV